MLVSISGKLGSGKDTVGLVIQYLVCLKLNTLAAHQFNFEDFKKSTASNEIQSGFKIKKFANKLKDIVCLLINCTREQLEDAEFKEKELGEDWDKYFIIEFGNQVMSYYKKDLLGNITDFDTLPFLFPTLKEAEKALQEKVNGILAFRDITQRVGKVKKIKLTPRLLLQNIGTDLFRNQLHPNIWVNSLMSEYKPELILTREEKIAKLIKEKTVAKDWNEVSNDELDRILKSYHYIPSNWIITDTRFPNELKAVEQRNGISIRVERGSMSMVELANQHESETALDSAEFDYVIENNSTIEELIHNVKNILTQEKII